MLAVRYVSMGISDMPASGRLLREAGFWRDMKVDPNTSLVRLMARLQQVPFRNRNLD
jgi:hypothetical protein